VKQLEPPPKEPFFAPGGLWLLAQVVVTFIAIWLLGDVINFVLTLLGL